jgi:hypothetical protein
LKSFPGILDFCYKDPQTIYMLKRNASTENNIVEIMELDLLHQTIRKQVETPLFEGVTNEDGRYNVLYNGERVLVVYPTNTIVQYESQTLEVIHVVQCAFNIVLPVIL